MNRCSLLVLVVISASISAHAQTPNAIPYQAAARTSSGAVIASQPVGVRFTIRDSVATGAIKYRETHNVTTSAQGMFSVNIGQGTPVAGSFSGINWSTNAKFLQVELDPAGGSSYTDIGTQQMMSVPYAKFAETASSLINGGSCFAHYIGELWGGGIVYHVYRGTDGLEHGLIVALTDQSTAATWSNVTSTLIGTSAQSNWNGLANSNAIVSQAGHTNSAAKLCLDLVSGGFSDWYLPSRQELNLLFNTQYNTNMILGTISGATELNRLGDYWSSTELNASIVWYIGFFSGNSDSAPKNIARYVRAVRSF